MPAAENGKAMKKERGRRTAGMICLCLAVAFGVGVSGCGKNSGPSAESLEQSQADEAGFEKALTKDADKAAGETVMEIAGQPVAKAEYQMTIKNYDAGIKGQYTTEEANQKDFWTVDSGEGRPLDQLMEQVREDLVYKKVVAKLAKEAGISQETDFMSILEQAKTGNTNKESGEAAGKTAGALNLQRLEDYYAYAFTAAESQLTEYLKKQYQVTEAELKEIYQENSEQYTSEISVRVLAAETEDPELASQIAEELLKETFGQAAEDLPEKSAGQTAEELSGETSGQTAEELSGETSGQTAEDLSEESAGSESGRGEESLQERFSGKFPDAAFYEIEMSSLNMEEGKTGAYMQRWLTASSMQEGQVCEPFQIGERWMVMCCLQREEQAVKPFEEVKGSLENEVRSRMAREEIEKNVQEAEVKWKKDVLEQAALEALQD